MATRTLLILGAGSNIGNATAKLFAANGYKVAVNSRSGKEQFEKEGFTHISGDLADPANVPLIFEAVRQHLGTPTVVIYNAATLVPTEADNPLSIPVAELARTLAVNTLSVYVAAQEALKGFAQLPSSTPRAFLYTGNGLNVLGTLPKFVTLGMGKAATAHLIESANEAYKDLGYKFHYVDERKANGSYGMGIDGQAHAEFFWQLAEGDADIPWLSTFVKGQGYTKF